MKGQEDKHRAATNAQGNDPEHLEPESPSVHMCLFGKHRVWPDFVSLNETNDPALTHLYETVYCRCLNAVQTGVWGTDLATVVPRFGHLMVSLTGMNDAVIGTLVGSIDSLGRRQPLMLAARVEGMQYHRSVPCLAPMLRNLTSQILDVTEEAVVHQTLRRSEAWFTVRLESAPPAMPDHAGRLLRSLLAEPSIAASGEGLHRVVYQLIGHDPTGIDAPWQTPPGLRDRLPAQVRVALDTERPEQGIERWLCLLHFLCGNVYPITAFAPFEQPWCDLIVGQLGNAEIATLLRLPEEEGNDNDGDDENTAESPALDQKSTDPEPYTHCIPFSLDADFRAHVAAFRERAQSPPVEPGDSDVGDRNRVLTMQTAIIDAGHSVQTSLSPVLGTALARHILMVLAIIAAVIILSFGAFQLLKHLSQTAVPRSQSGDTTHALVMRSQRRSDTPRWQNPAPQTLYRTAASPDVARIALRELGSDASNRII